MTYTEKVEKIRANLISIINDYKSYNHLYDSMPHNLRIARQYLWEINSCLGFTFSTTPRVLNHYQMQKIIDTYGSFEILETGDFVQLIRAKSKKDNTKQYYVAFYPLTKLFKNSWEDFVPIFPIYPKVW